MYFFAFICVFICTTDASSCFAVPICCFGAGLGPDFVVLLLHTSQSAPKKINFHLFMWITFTSVAAKNVGRTILAERRRTSVTQQWGCEMLGQVLVFPVWGTITGMASHHRNYGSRLFSSPKKSSCSGMVLSKGPRKYMVVPLVLIGWTLWIHVFFFLISWSEHFMSLNFVLLNVNCTRCSSRRCSWQTGAPRVAGHCLWKLQPLTLLWLKYSFPECC